MPVLRLTFRPLVSGLVVLRHVAIAGQFATQVWRSGAFRTPPGADPASVTGGEGGAVVIRKVSPESTTDTQGDPP